MLYFFPAACRETHLIMKKSLLALALFASASLASAGQVSLITPALGQSPMLASTPAGASTTLELAVVGLNCSLCSEEMKSKLKNLSGAQDIEPRLECGKIYVDVPVGTRLNDRILSATLLQNGFTYGGAKPSKKSVAEVRKAKQETC